MRQRGFTLVELLVAMAIVAIIGAMALGGLNEVLKQQAVATERTDRWRAIQFAMRMIVQDLSQIHPRPMRQELGDGWRPSLWADPRGDYALEFSHGGWSNPAGVRRGTVQRVAYDVEEDKLIRTHWAVVDRTFGSAPIRYELLDQVEQVEVRFLDNNGQWRLEWPGLQQSSYEDLVLRPRAVEFAIYLTDFGKVWRIVEVGG